MKTSTKAKLGAGALAVATMFGTAACQQPTQETITIIKAPELAPPETLSLNADGTLKINLIYRKGTDVTKIKNAATDFAGNNGTTPTTTKNGMISRNGNYKIIVEFADSGVPKYNGLIATNGETVRVHADWLSSVTAISIGDLRNVFNAMLGLDPVAQAAMMYNEATNTITIARANALSGNQNG